LRLASEELRAALANIVRRAVEQGWVDEGRAMRWLEKLERGVVAWEGKKFMVRLSGSGALEVRFRSTSRKSVEEVVREFKAMGLVEDKHFAVRWSGEGGRVSLLAEGVRRLAWVSTHGEGEQRRRAEKFLKFLEEKAKAKGAEVLRKLEALVEEGRGRGALRLVGLEKDGVKVLDVKTEERGDKLYVTIRAEIDGVEEEYKITFYRERDGIRYLRFYVKGGEAVARAVKLVEVLTGERPSARGDARRQDDDQRIRETHRRPCAVRRAERGDREVEQPINIPTSRVACRMNSTAGKGPRRRGST
jgi:hypothetical protein